LRENELDMSPQHAGNPLLPSQPEQLISLDKIFSGAWADDHALLAGTKDNRIIHWQFNRDYTVRSRNVFTMPDTRPPGPPRGGQHQISFNADFGGTSMACGGNDPNSLIVFDYPSMQPRLQLRGNTDWMFSCCWVDRDRLLSCSRDKTLRMWNTATRANSARQFLQRYPKLTREEHSDKIRDMKFNTFKKHVATVSTDGIVKLWDSDRMDVISTLMAPESHDLVCMAFDELNSDRLALGSRRHVTFVDPRCDDAHSTVLHTNAVPNDDSGVRSVSFRQHLVTVGTGGGHLLFFDIRRASWVGRPGQVRTGEGWIRRDMNYDYMYPDLTAGQGQPSHDGPKNAVRRCRGL
jgi:WD repeat-containing protein 40A